MSSQLYPTIPQIETASSSPRPGRRSPNPDPMNSSFCSTSSHTHTPARSASPAHSGRSVPSASGLSRGTPAHQLLQTPPATDTHPNANYFSARSTSRHTQNTSPSDGLSASSCLSPLPSSGGSFYSSDRSQCSHSSNEYLSPPRTQPDSDNPPYKARSQRSNSLTMIPKIRRAKTDPNDKTYRGHRARGRQRRRHKCRHRQIKRYEHQDETDWWLPECQVAPTAPQGFKYLCLGRAGNYIPAKTPQGTTDTFGRILSERKSRPASPLLTRRWSSVEIGAHQIHLKSTLPKRPPKLAKSALATPAGGGSKFDSPDLKGRYRSSTFTRGAIDHDIIRTVRERLTLRKVPRTQLETPASITLRRASGASNMSDASTIIAAMTPQPDLSGGTTPKVRSHGELHQRRPSAAYLITSRDIDSITELIEANLKRQHRDDRRRDIKPQSGSPPTSKGARSPSFTRKGLVPAGCPPTIPAVTAVKVARSSAGAKAPFDYLQVIPALQRKRSMSRTNSQKSQQSTHEVIWQGGGSPQSVSSVTDDEESRTCVPSSEPVTPVDAPQQHAFHSATKDKGDAFDPKNATASINEWSWRSMRNEVCVVVTSSDSESNEQTPRGSQGSQTTKFRKSIASRISEPKRDAAYRDRPHPKFSPRESELEDVVSFPPLPPRKTTSDWYSPLPDLETPLESPSSSLKNSRSLYDIGLDMTSAPAASTKTTPKVTPKATPKVIRSSWLQSSDISRVPSVEFDPSYNVQDNKMIKPESRTSSFEIGPDANDRRKSSVRIHPKTTTRTGESFAMGNSIGVSSGERRRSSAKVLQRVRTIDNVHKGERTTSWGRWRPPSICPTPQIPSPSELEAESEESSNDKMTRQQRQLETIRKSHGDRMAIIKDRGPPLPKVDHVGIYGRFTGNTKTVPKDCEEDCKPHTCEDCERDPRTPSVDWIG